MSFLTDLGNAPSAVASVIGSVLGYRSNKKTNAANLQIARETNENEYRMFQEGNEFNRQMAEYQNEWNSAAAQRKRLEEAGYNPASLFGSSQIPAASASSLPAPQLQRAEMRPFDPSPYLTILGQNVAAFADAKKSMAEAKGLEIENANKQNLFNAQIDDLVARKLLSNEQANEIRQSVEFKDANWDVLSKQVESMAMQTYHNAKNAQMEGEILKVYGMQRANAEVQNLIADAALKVEQGNTEEAKRVLMKIQGDAEKANVAINKMTAQSVVALNAALANKANFERFVMDEFGEPKLAQEFLNLVEQGKQEEVETWIAQSEMHANFARRLLSNTSALMLVPFIHGKRIIERSFVK